MEATIVEHGGDEVNTSYFWSLYVLAILALLEWTPAEWRFGRGPATVGHGPHAEIPPKPHHTRFEAPEGASSLALKPLG
jgi:hypothetical protein